MNRYSKLMLRDCLRDVDKHELKVMNDIASISGVLSKSFKVGADVQSDIEKSKSKITEDFDEIRIYLARINMKDRPLPVKIEQISPESGFYGDMVHYVLAEIYDTLNEVNGVYNNHSGRS